MNTVTERPILFNSDMVRTILDGRKTQTRRCVKPILNKDGNYIHGGNVDLAHKEILEWRLQDGRWFGLYGYTTAAYADCPYGQVGDRLWVRETWGVISHSFNEDGDMIEWTPDRPATHVHELKFGCGYYTGHVIYASDGDHEWAGDDDGGGEPRSAWHPSIHMPRAASRITLEITNVRIERLHRISESDSMQEGSECLITKNCTAEDRSFLNLPIMDDLHPYKNGFALQWNSIYGNWKSNPWVWAIEFKVVD